MSFLNLFSKAGRVVVQNQPSNFFQLIQGESPLRFYSPIDLVGLNSGYVGICNTRNAMTTASIPLKLYYKKSAGKVIERTSIKSIRRNEQIRIAKGLNLILKQAEEIVEIIEHPYLDLMSQVNPSWNGFDLTQQIQSYLGLIGNAYVEIISDGKPVELHPLLSEYITCFATNGRDGRITKYEYALPNTDKKDYKPEQILHFINYQPGSNIVGKGELEMCVTAAELFNYYLAYESYLNKNFGKPDFAIAYKNALNEKDLKEITKLWFKKFAGVQNSGKPVITSGEFDVKNLGFSPREMQFGAGKSFCQKEIANAYGIPEAFLELNSSNLASSLTAESMYYKYTIYPKMVKYVERLNERLLPLFDTGLYTWFEESQFDDPNKASNVREAFAAGIITLDEAREQMGYEAIVEGQEIPTPAPKPTVTV